MRLRGNYGVAVVITLVGLCPYLVVTTGFTPLADQVTADLSASPTTIQLGAGLGNAGYAVGAVFAAQLTQRFAQRRLFLGVAPVLVAGSLLGGFAQSGVAFGVGRTLEGLGAGAMLICALPMLLTRFGVRLLSVSVGVVNVGIFGASALGPTVGGLVAAGHHWRGLFWVVAGCAAFAWVVALVGFLDNEAPDPERPIDRPALGLVLVVTLATFVATSLLTSHAFLSATVLVPLVVGLLALPVLVVLEDRKEESLIPVRALSTQLPVSGILAAMIGGAVFVTTVELVQTQLAQGAMRSPTSTAWLFWPTPVGALAAAVVLGVLFRTRWLPILVDVGMASLVVGAGVLIGLDPSTPGALVSVSALLLGFGAGATVSPGLFLTSLGLPATQLGRSFAMVQLLRATATYAVGPILMYVAVQAATITGGVQTGLAVMTILAGLGLVALLVIPLVSGARLRRPDLEGWLDGGQALPSPLTAVHLRPGTEDESAAPLLPSSSPAPRHRR